MEPRPCPFCGQKPEVKEWEYDNGSDWRVQCINENCSGGEYITSTLDKAISEWNKQPYIDWLQKEIAFMLRVIHAYMAGKDELAVSLMSKHSDHT